MNVKSQIDPKSRKKLKKFKDFHFFFNSSSLESMKYNFVFFPGSIGPLTSFFIIKSHKESVNEELDLIKITLGYIFHKNSLKINLNHQSTI